MTPATPSRPSRNVASPPPCAPGARPAAASVAIPRSTRNAANGPSVAPVSIWAERTAAMSSRDPTTAPAITSRVTGQVLRPRLHHEVRAVLERPAHGRRGEGVVDGQQRPVPVRGLGEGRDVGEHAGRVGDGLDVEDAGPRGGQRGLDGRDVGGVDVHDLDAEPPERGRGLACAWSRSRPCRSPAGRRRAARTGVRRGSRPCRSRGRSRPRRHASSATASPSATTVGLSIRL